MWGKRSNEGRIVVTITTGSQGIQQDGHWIDNNEGSSHGPEYAVDDCERLDEIPSADVFLKEYVIKQVPLIIRNGMNSPAWKAVRDNWNEDYLREHHGGIQVTGRL